MSLRLLLRGLPHLFCWPLDWHWRCWSDFHPYHFQAFFWHFEFAFGLCMHLLVVLLHSFSIPSDFESLFDQFDQRCLFSWACLLIAVSLLHSKWRQLMAETLSAFPLLFYHHTLDRNTHSNCPNCYDESSMMPAANYFYCTFVDLLRQISAGRSYCRRSFNSQIDCKPSCFWCVLQTDTLQVHWGCKCSCRQTLAVIVRKSDFVDCMIWLREVKICSPTVFVGLRRPCHCFECLSFDFIDR